MASSLSSSSSSSPELVEFLTLRFKPALLPDAASPPASFASVAASMQALPGVTALYLGQRVEPAPAGEWTAVVRWASPAAHDAFVASPASTQRAADLRALVVADGPHPPPARAFVLSAGDVAAALAAPTLEVCTAWAVDDDFVAQRLAPFAEAVDAARLPGYHAYAHGHFDQTPQEGVDVPSGRAARLLIGWDSKDAHLQHKDTGSALDQHIHLIRSGRKSLELYHLNLKKL